MLILDGKKVYEKGDIVVKIKLVNTFNPSYEWSIGTKGEVIGVQGPCADIKNLDAIGTIGTTKHCDMKNWELEKKREFQVGDRIRFKDCDVSRNCGIVGCTGVITKFGSGNRPHILSDANDNTWKNSAPFQSHWKGQITFTTDVDILELCDPTQVSSPANKKPKRTNDNRNTCYACGNSTQFIGCLPGTRMKICIKCKR